MRKLEKIAVKKPGEPKPVKHEKFLDLKNPIPFKEIKHLLQDKNSLNKERPKSRSILNFKPSRVTSSLENHKPQKPHYFSVKTSNQMLKEN